MAGGSTKVTQAICRQREVIKPLLIGIWPKEDNGLATSIHCHSNDDIQLCLAICV